MHIFSLDFYCGVWMHRCGQIDIGCDQFKWGSDHHHQAQEALWGGGVPPSLPCCSALYSICLMLVCVMMNVCYICIPVASLGGGNYLAIITVLMFEKTAWSSKVSYFTCQKTVTSKDSLVKWLSQNYWCVINPPVVSKYRLTEGMPRTVCLDLSCLVLSCVF